ncbi:DUF2787 domain-containing protein [Vibrio cholerae]|nr:DUF2787 domain-containing protein [Vibrio cholerae]
MLKSRRSRACSHCREPHYDSSRADRHPVEILFKRETANHEAIAFIAFFLSRIMA